MPFRFLQIPARGCEQTESEMNLFLQSHRVLTVDRHLVDAGEKSFWAICIDYLEGAERSTSRRGRSGQQNRIDYREVLSAEEFVKFSVLREVRKTLAAEDAVPVYAVMTNKQLAEIVQTQVSDRQGLSAISGLGEARVEKYGDRILQVMNLAEGDQGEAAGRPV
jgi:superfamily II DNA helicase RecQ